MEEGCFCHRKKKTVSKSRNLWEPRESLETQDIFIFVRFILTLLITIINMHRKMTIKAKGPFEHRALTVLVFNKYDFFMWNLLHFHIIADYCINSFADHCFLIHLL